LTQPEQIYKSWRAALIKRYIDLNGSMLDFDKPDRSFLEQCEKYDIQCHSTLNQVRQEVVKNNRLNVFVTDPHYNSFGNYVHANIIYEEIRHKI
jgi:hypothetical protein